MQDIGSALRTGVELIIRSSKASFASLYLKVNYLTLCRIRILDRHASRLLLLNTVVLSSLSVRNVFSLWWHL